MRFTAAGAVALCALTGAAVADQCARGSTEIGGNWYCQAVKKITYQNLQGSGGTYNKVTSMDSNSGLCTSEPHHFSGKMSPLDDDMSFHIRGPARLKQFAVYVPGPAGSKVASRSPHTHAVKHGHHHYHKKPAPVTLPGDWVRSAYYNSASGTADGVTFLNNKGGSASGVFDYVFGNSLGYAGSNGIDNCASSEVLSDTLIPSNEEVIIMSDKKCTGGSCGYTRPGGVSYHGFEGANKAFFMEFSMPDDGKTGWNENMPAIWLLNGQIPRTLQYGKPECSCWTSGCGEVDLFEVLDGGNHRMKSTLHGYFQGGDSDWFQRPTAGTMKAAVVFDDEEIHLQVLSDDYKFSRRISSVEIDEIKGNVPELLSSIFAVVAS